MAVLKPLRVRAYCPKCKAATELEGKTLAGPWECPCGEKRVLPGPYGDGAEPSSGAPRPVVRCAYCGCGELYIEKDFNQGLGCLIMLAAPVIPFFLPWPYGKGLLASVLALAAIDFILYYAVVPFRSVCYACCAEHRGGAPNPGHEPYELTKAELFQEKISRI
jgi:hypothetical protein